MIPTANDNMEKSERLLSTVVHRVKSYSPLLILLQIFFLMMHWLISWYHFITFFPDWILHEFGLLVASFIISIVFISKYSKSPLYVFFLVFHFNYIFLSAFLPLYFSLFIPYLLSLFIFCNYMVSYQIFFFFSTLKCGREVFCCGHSYKKSSDFNILFKKMLTQGSDSFSTVFKSSKFKLCWYLSWRSTICKGIRSGSLAAFPNDFLRSCTFLHWIRL